ncbi:MAG: hypothetical protein OXM01_08975 [Gemmatimonadota bacterium]|nr:hypothetical protein [Gemmatimonadota bacterium]
MSDFESDANFHRDLQLLLDDVDLSIDQRLEGLVGLLNRLEPALLANAVEWTDQEIAEAFLEFVTPANRSQETRASRLLTALVGAAEFKRRADRAGLAALQYAHLIRVRRELGDH